METLCDLNYITIDDKKYDFYNALDDNDEIDLSLIGNQPLVTEEESNLSEAKIVDISYIW